MAVVKIGSATAFAAGILAYATRKRLMARQTRFGLII